MSRPTQCQDCGAKFDAFGVCPNASAQDAAVMRGTVSCGKGQNATPLEVWSVLAACESTGHAMNIRALPETRVSTPRHAPPGSIAA